MVEDERDGEEPADDEAGEAEDVPDGYDPASPTPPARAPTLRSTAPQSEYTTGQVAFGFVVLAIGLLVVFALPLALG